MLFNGVAAPAALRYGRTGGQQWLPTRWPGHRCRWWRRSAGAASAPVAVAVAATAPGIFTADGSGRGQAAALNQNGIAERRLGAGASRFGARVFCHRRRPDAQPGVDGKLGTAPLPEPVARVSVTIGGVAAEVRYAGGAPGQIAGTMQVNVVVPGGLSGAVPLVVTVGSASSQAAVTVAVR